MQKREMLNECMCEPNWRIGRVSETLLRLDIAVRNAEIRRADIERPHFSIQLS